MEFIVLLIGGKEERVEINGQLEDCEIKQLLDAVYGNKWLKYEKA